MSVGVSLFGDGFIPGAVSLPQLTLTDAVLPPRGRWRRVSPEYLRDAPPQYRFSRCED